MEPAMKKRFFLKNLAVFLLPIMVPMILLGSLSIAVLQSYIKNEISSSHIRQLNQTKEHLELMLNEMDSLILTLDNHSKINNVLGNLLENQLPKYEDIVPGEMLQAFLNAPANARPYIHSIYAYYRNDHGLFVSSNVGVANLNSYWDTGWYDGYRNHDGKAEIWTEPRNIKQYSFEKDEKRIVTVYRKLHTGDGMMALNLSRDYIEDILRSLAVSSEQCVLVFNEKGQLLFSSSMPDDLKQMPIVQAQEDHAKESLLALQSHSDSFIVNQVNSNRYGWEYFSIVPKKSLFRVPTQLSAATLLLLLVSLVVSMLLAYYFTSLNYNRLSSMMSIIDSAVRGKPLPPLPVTIKDEYGYILHNILTTFIEQNYLKVQLSEQKYRLQAAKLLALQSQINPHFLYNTLNAIYWEVFKLTAKPNQGTEMIENLSHILDYSLSCPAQTVTLQEEIDHTKSYIRIQKFRHKDKFEVTWKGNHEEIQHFKIVKLLLQPLVENSIYHGIKETTTRVVIRIKIMLRGNRLKISVTDNGMGIEKDRLAEIRRQLSEGSESPGHIGLFNTNIRLKLSYGEPYGITIKSKHGFGTSISFDIPVAAPPHDSFPLCCQQEED